MFGSNLFERVRSLPVRRPTCGRGSRACLVQENEITCQNANEKEVLGQPAGDSDTEVSGTSHINL